MPVTEQLHAGGIGEGAFAVQILSVDGMGDGVGQQQHLGFALSDRQQGLLLPPAADQYAGQAQQPDDAVSGQQRQGFPVLDGQRRIHRNGNTDAAANVSRLVTLLRVTLQAGFFGHHRLYETEVVSAILHFLDAGHLFLSSLEGRKGFYLPGVRLVNGIDRLEAGYMAAQRCVVPVHQLVHLARHIGRVHQRQVLAGFCCDIPLRDVTKIRVGWGRLRYRDINPAMAGNPVAVLHVHAMDALGLSIHLGIKSLPVLLKAEINRSRDGTRPSQHENQHIAPDALQLAV